MRLIAIDCRARISRHDAGGASAYRMQMWAEDGVQKAQQNCWTAPMQQGVNMASCISILMMLLRIHDFALNSGLVF